jgi:hypothetical protein
MGESASLWRLDPRHRCCGGEGEGEEASEGEGPVGEGEVARGRRAESCQWERERLRDDGERSHAEGATRG